MSLSYNMTKMVDREVNFPPFIDEKGEAHQNPDLYRMIWSCLFLDIPEISEKTVDEFYFRYNFYRALLGPLFLGPEWDFSIDIVRKAIGLSTNVAPLTRAQFIKKTVKFYGHDLEQQIRK